MLFSYCSIDPVVVDVCAITTDQVLFWFASATLGPSQVYDTHVWGVFSRLRGRLKLVLIFVTNEELRNIWLQS